MRGWPPRDRKDNSLAPVLVAGQTRSSMVPSGQEDEGMAEQSRIRGFNPGRSDAAKPPESGDIDSAAIGAPSKSGGSKRRGRGRGRLALPLC